MRWFRLRIPRVFVRLSWPRGIFVSTWRYLIGYNDHTVSGMMIFSRLIFGVVRWTARRDLRVLVSAL